MREEDGEEGEEGKKGFVQGVGFKRETGRYDIRTLPVVPSAKLRSAFLCPTTSIPGTGSVKENPPTYHLMR